MQKYDAAGICRARDVRARKVCASIASPVSWADPGARKTEHLAAEMDRIPQERAMRGRNKNETGLEMIAVRKNRRAGAANQRKTVESLSHSTPSLPKVGRAKLVICSVARCRSRRRICGFFRKKGIHLDCKMHIRHRIFEWTPLRLLSL